MPIDMIFYGIMSVPQNIIMDLDNITTCCDLSVFLYRIEAYSIDSSQTVANSPEVSNFNQLFLKTQPVHM